MSDETDGTDETESARGDICKRCGANADSDWYCIACIEQMSD